MKLTGLKIDPDFKELLPPLDAETYTALEKDIVANGLLDPIIIWKYYIADGHNRYEICKNHRIEDVKVSELKSCKTKSEVMDWIITHQGSRRNMTKRELALVYAKYEEQLAKEARERQKQAGQEFGRGQAEKVSSILNKAIGDPIRTAAIVAKKVGVSENTYRDLKIINEKGTEEQKQRADKGGRGNSVSTIASEIKEGVKEGERKCKACGRILPISEFHDKKSPFRCLECENKRKRESAEERRKAMMVIPDAINPDKEKEVSDSMIVAKFESILTEAICTFRSTFKYQTRMNDFIKEEIIKALDEHIKQVKNLKGEMENEASRERV